MFSSLSIYSMYIYSYFVPSIIIYYYGGISFCVQQALAKKKMAFIINIYSAMIYKNNK